MSRINILNHADIAARIPHTGSMCLLHSVEDWAHTHIDCTAISHIDPANPLRRSGVLASLNLIEYAAQAMAVHGSLLQEQVQQAALAKLEANTRPPQQGRLVSVRNVALFTQDLSLYSAPLRLHCELLLGDALSSTFSFTVHADDHLLGQGRASVMLIKMG
jgi:predicted hotdog family 3-hydroxylacyl-ACP dehydratase